MINAIKVTKKRCLWQKKIRKNYKNYENDKKVFCEQCGRGSGGKSFFVCWVCPQMDSSGWPTSSLSWWICDEYPPSPTKSESPVSSFSLWALYSLWHRRNWVFKLMCQQQSVTKKCPLSSWASQPAHIEAKSTLNCWQQLTMIKRDIGGCDK